MLEINYFVLQYYSILKFIIKINSNRKKFYLLMIFHKSNFLILYFTGLTFIVLELNFIVLELNFIVLEFFK